MKGWQKTLWHGAMFCMIGAVLLNGTVTLQPLRLVQRWAEQFPQAAPVYAPAANMNEPAAEEEETIKGRLTLQLEEYSALPRCRVLVNGEEAARFETAAVEIEAPDHALLEIDATYYTFPVIFTVAETSENLTLPRAGRQVHVQQGIALLGEVRLTP